MARELLTTANAKTIKGEKLGYLTGIMYLAPAQVGGPNVCPSSSPGCAAACLYTAGRGAFNNVQQARINKKTFFFANRAEFMNDLFESVARIERRAVRLGLRPCVRLNGTSDINWENIRFWSGAVYGSIMEHFPHIQFYDYTKRPIAKRLRDSPANYDLTFSLSEDNWPQAKEALQGHGIRIAAVFRDPPLGKKYRINGEGPLRPVVDGDQHDLRFLDPQGVVVALSAKGDAKKDKTGFVI